MAMSPQQLSLTLIFDAGVLFMGVISGGLKDIAPPEMPKFWAILGTIAASGAFLSAKLLFGLYDIPVSQEVWFGVSLIFIWLAIICGVIYILTRSSRTITYQGQTQLAGSPEEYLPAVAKDPQNKGKTRDELLSDAAGVAGDVWTAKALNKSRRILGIEYTLFISLLAFGFYLGIEAFNAPRPDPTFAEKVAKLKDVHFELDKSDLSPDAADLLNSDAEILKDVFKEFKKATVTLEGYCDDRGTDGYNFILGYKRAEAVRQALLTFHIDKDKIAVSSRGKQESICQADVELCHQKDRRVRLTVTQN
jgi:outer membrane protein OmpA-like peptidoglycan-associated protein